MSWNQIAPSVRDGVFRSEVKSQYTWYTNSGEKQTPGQTVEFTSEAPEQAEDYIVDDYEDPAEYFAVHTLLGADGGDLLSSMSWLENTGYATVATSDSNVGEVQTAIQEQIGSLYPQILALSSAEFLALLQLEEAYSETGAPYIRATIDIPVPEGFSTIQVKISEVV